MSIDRRSLLALGGVATVTLAAGCGVSPPQREEQLQCAPKSAMTEVSAIGGRALVYEISETPSSFPIEPGFLALFETWQQYWLDHSGLPGHDQIWTYGAWVDNGGCNSWHGAGRAFDIGRLRLDGVPIVSCREDLWSVMDDQAQRDVLRRRYWALAASLHLHFAYVLTYLFDDAHRNHIHVDNGVSGTELSRFSTRSRVQCQALQAICTYLWNVPVELTGEWDTATKAATTEVLSRLGVAGDAARGDNWAAFLAASVGRAAE
ncbi:extensin family protein [Microlunatus sp. Y2014]|uniref:extensin family protein n=1 Tax=Microlunatus sp. Y2014 TaxID=3418488 RepID=UPI003DA746D8